MDKTREFRISNKNYKTKKSEHPLIVIRLVRNVNHIDN